MEKLFSVKVIIVGDCSVGKSSLLLRFSDNTYLDDIEATCPIDFKLVTKELSDGNTIKLQIWDTGGQERFRTLTGSFFRGANGVLLCYDTTNKQSFINLRQWLGEIYRNSGDLVDIILVGTKCDELNQKVIDTAKAALFAEELGLLFFETSAKENIQVEAVFTELISVMMKNQQSRANPHSLDGSNRIEITNGIIKPASRNAKCSC